MEHETNTSTACQLTYTQVIAVSINDLAKVIAKVGDDRQDSIARACIAHSAAQRRQLDLELFQLRLDARLDIRQRVPDMMHENGA